MPKTLGRAEGRASEIQGAKVCSRLSGCWRVRRFYASGFHAFSACPLTQRRFFPGLQKKLLPPLKEIFQACLAPGQQHILQDLVGGDHTRVGGLLQGRGVLLGQASLLRYLLVKRVSCPWWTCRGTGRGGSGTSFTHNSPALHPALPCQDEAAPPSQPAPQAIMPADPPSNRCESTFCLKSHQQRHMHQRVHRPGRCAAGARAQAGEVVVATVAGVSWHWQARALLRGVCISA